MPRKKAANATQSRAEVIDKIFAQVDPEIVAAGLLGAVAARGGLVPPFTQLLMSMTSEGGVAESMKQNWMDIAKFGSVGWMAGEFTLTNLETLFGLFTKPDATPEEKKAVISSSAIMASGMMEGMLMMAFMKKPGSMTMIQSLIGSNGLGAIAKAL